MAHLHLVIGPVGSGKSSFAAELRHTHRALGFNLDAWMAALYGDDERPESGRIEWYLARTGRCVEQIWRVAEEAIELGMDVVFEIGLILRRDRESFYARADTIGRPLTIYVLDAPRELRRQRVERRNRERGPTYSMEVPPEFFELASDMWQPPDDDECRGRDVRFFGSS
jgi:predicted kinase